MDISTLILHYYSSFHLSKIRKYRKRSCPSVCLAEKVQPINLSSHPHVCPFSCIPPCWLDGFSSYWVPWSGTMGRWCTIEFGSVLNLSNYRYFSFECLLWYRRVESGDFVHIWYSYQVLCVVHACKIAFCSVPNFSNYGHFFIHFVYL